MKLHTYYQQLASIISNKVHLGNQFQNVTAIVNTLRFLLYLPISLYILLDFFLLNWLGEKKGNEGGIVFVY